MAVVKLKRTLLWVAIAGLALPIATGCRRGPRVTDATYREAVVAFYVSLKFPEWFEQLVLLERLAVTSRDDVMFEMTAARARLAKVKKSLEARQQSPQSIDVRAILAENVVPILALVLKRERTLAQVGALAGKIGLTAVNQILRKMKGK